MLRIVICDDDIFFTSEIERLLLKIEKEDLLELNIEVFFDGQELVKSILNGVSYNIIYLDIKMKYLNGIDTAKKIREIDREVLILYISSYEVYIKQLFEVEPFRFLDKPLDTDYFMDCFRKAYQKILENKQFFLYRFKKEIHSIILNNIFYFESSGKTIYIKTETKSEKFYGKLNDVEKEIQRSGNTFIRIHHSYLVNFMYIKKINFSEVTLHNGLLLPISERKQKIIRKKYCDILGKLNDA